MTIEWTEHPDEPPKYRVGENISWKSSAGPIETLPVARVRWEGYLKQWVYEVQFPSCLVQIAESQSIEEPKSVSNKLLAWLQKKTGIHQHVGKVFYFNGDRASSVCTICGKTLLKWVAPSGMTEEWRKQNPYWELEYRKIIEKFLETL